MQPLYFKFSTKNNTYLYDGVTSEVIPYNDIYEQILKDYWVKDCQTIYKNYFSDKLSYEEFFPYYLEMEHFINLGMFFVNDSVINKHDVEYDIEFVSTSYLILVMTEECNMRCRYCVYSDKYYNASNYSNQKMTIETAKKAIDQYLLLHKKRQMQGLKRNPEIGFYGGEPLLNYKVIKEVVEYVKSKQIKCEFYITTNGVLLTNEVIEFMISNDFKVTFSLDGDKENHDRNRVMENGKQTFDIVMKNINKFVKKRDELNKKNLAFSFSCCFDYETNLKKMIKFFVDNYDLFNPFFIIYSQIDPYDTTYYDCKNSNQEIVSKFQKQLHEIRNEFFKLEQNDKRFHEVVASLFLGVMTAFNRNKWQISPYFGSCIPLTKIAVYPDGTINMCEKMAKRFPLGNVNEGGLNIEKLNELDQLFFDNYINGKCSKCPYRSLCQVCYVNLNEDGTINQQYCDDQKLFVKSTLSYLYSILEENPNIKDKFKLKSEYLGIFEHNQ